MKTYTLRLTEAQWLRVYALADAQEIPVSQVIRDAIKAHLSKHGDKIIRSLPSQNEPSKDIG